MYSKGCLSNETRHDRLIRGRQNRSLEPLPLDTFSYQIVGDDSLRSLRPLLHSVSGFICIDYVTEVAPARLAAMRRARVPKRQESDPRSTTRQKWLRIELDVTGDPCATVPSLKNDPTVMKG